MDLTLPRQPVYERKMGVKFIWGEVKELNGARKTASTLAESRCLGPAGMCSLGWTEPRG